MTHFAGDIDFAIGGGSEKPDKIRKKRYPSYFSCISAIFCPFWPGNVSFERAKKTEQTVSYRISKKLDVDVEKICFLREGSVFLNRVFLIVSPFLIWQLARVIFKIVHLVEHLSLYKLTMKTPKKKFQKGSKKAKVYCPERQILRFFGWFCLVFEDFDKINYILSEN